MTVTTEGERFAAWGDPCIANGDVTLATVQFTSTTGLRGIGVNARALPAFAALATVFDRYGYLLDGSDTGSYSCRKIGGGTTSSRSWSAHAWATAIDVNWLENPDGPKLTVDPLMHPDIPNAAEALVTVSGDPVWRWGGDWDRDDSTGHTYYDAMHFECIATPEAIATGIIDPGGTNMTQHLRVGIDLLWVEVRGTHVEPSGTETSQQRLTRITTQVIEGRTMENLRGSLEGLNVSSGRTTADADLLRATHATYMPAWVYSENLEPSEWGGTGTGPQGPKGDKGAKGDRGQAPAMIDATVTTWSD